MPGDWHQWAGLIGCMGALVALGWMTARGK